MGGFEIANRGLKFDDMQTRGDASTLYRRPRKYYTNNAIHCANRFKIPIGCLQVSR